MAELEEENAHYRQALSLPPSTRLPLGKGPTGKDLPYQEVERPRRQTISPSGGSSAGSPASYTSSPASPSLTASSISSRTMTMIEAGPSQWNDSMLLNERQAFSEGHPEQAPSPSQPIPIMAPLPFKGLNSPSYHERIVPPLHSPSSTFYPPDTPTSYSPTSERSVDISFDSRGHLLRSEEMQRNLYTFSQNYHVPDPDQHSEASVHTSDASVYQYHANTPQRDWDSHPSDRVRDYHHGFPSPEARRYHRSPEQVSPHIPQSSSYPRHHDVVNVPSPSRSSQQYSDGRHQII